jgi:type IV secretory pathway TrbD component
MVGGVLLRAAGLVVAALAALDLALVGNAAAVLLFVVGLALWLVGHWHYALRHHEYKSPPARRIFYLRHHRPPGIRRKSAVMERTPRRSTDPR